MLRTLLLLSTVLILPACNPDEVQVALAEDGSRTVITRAAAHPAWGDTRWTMRYAHNGQCDDPRYTVSNGGRADPGTDDYDCALYGGGLRD